MIKLHIGNVFCQIEGLIDPSLIQILDEELSYFVSGYQYSKLFLNGYFDRYTNTFKHWDGRKHLLTIKNLTFLSGLRPRVEKILKFHCCEYEIVDARQKPISLEKISIKNIESREYQDRIHQAFLNNNCGIVKSATGSGKSVSMAKIIAERNLNTNVFVPGVDLLYQTKAILEKILKIKVGIVGDSKCDVRRVNVISIWSACSALGKKYTAFDDEEFGKKEVIKNKDKTKIVSAIKKAEMILFDEAQFVAIDTISVINNASQNAYFKYGLSGTPSRGGVECGDMIIEGICGPMIVEVTASELIAKGFLVPPTIHFIDVPFMDCDKQTYHEVYKNYIVENEIRNAKIVKAVDKLLEMGRNVLVLVKRIKHGEILYDMLKGKYKLYFIRGEIDSDKRQQIKKEFESGDLKLLISTSIFDIGVDLPILNSLVMTSGGLSPGRTTQRLGRIIRKYPGKTDAILIEFWDNCRYLLGHSKARLETYQKEPAFKIKLPEKNTTTKNLIVKKKVKVYNKIEGW